MRWTEFLRRALSEKSGEPSSIRLFNAWVLFWLVLVISYGFVLVLHLWEDLIIMYLSVISGIIVAILGLKVSQKWKENRDDKID